MSSIAHVFYDIPMFLNHASLWSLLEANAKKNELEKGEYALFINSSWTAVKLLARGNHFLYHRQPNGGTISVEMIRRLTTNFEGHRLTFSKNLEDHLIAAYREKFGKAMRTMKVVSA